MPVRSGDNGRSSMRVPTSPASIAPPVRQMKYAPKESHADVKDLPAALEFD